MTISVFTKPSDDIADLLEFLRACQPDNPDATRRRGADRSAIAELERVSGVALPPVYEAYLKEFGEDSGFARLSVDGRDSVDALLAWYADPVEMSSTPPRALVIATGGVADGYILIDPLDSSSEMPVATFDGPLVKYVSSSCFRNFMYQQAWRRARYQGPVQIRPRYPYNDESRDLGATQRLFEKLELRTHWFSDAYGVYAESETAACYAVLTSDQIVAGVRTSTVDEGDRIVAILREELGFIGGDRR